MKRFIALVLCMMIVIGCFSGCSGNAKTESEPVGSDYNENGDLNLDLDIYQDDGVSDSGTESKGTTSTVKSSEKTSKISEVDKNKKIRGHDLDQR